jgi:DNA invertase Pin-like site-specific DNA recombinase
MRSRQSSRQGIVSPKAAVRPERVLALRAKGMSFRAIAAETGVSVMTVQLILKDLKDSDFN